MTSTDATPGGRGLTRRDTLVKLAGLAATAAGGTALAHAGDADATVATPVLATGTNAVSRGLLTCVLTPELTEGPYWIDGAALRRTITEGRPGTPLALRMTVLDVASCKPVRGAVVDIWHADALGEYSTGSDRFMRGVQRTNAKGVAEFVTVYPGWYPGRTVHIHVKVFVGGDVVHTGQVFFNDTVTDAVYRSAPYTTRPGRSPRNSGDSIFVNGGSKNLVAVRKAAGKGYIGTVTMGVQA